MLIRMRTTLIIDDELLRRAKRRAAEQDLTLSDLVNDALRTSLSQQEQSAPVPFRLVTYGRAAATARHEPADFADALESEDRERLGRRC